MTVTIGERPARFGRARLTRPALSASALATSR
jgi:hypothetical protein